MVNILKIFEVAEEIEAELKSDPALHAFAQMLGDKHIEFLGKLADIDPDDVRGVMSITYEVIANIIEAERDKNLKGLFRETNLDWAYARKFFLRQFLNDCVDPEIAKAVQNEFRGIDLS